MRGNYICPGTLTFESYAAAILAAVFLMSTNDELRENSLRVALGGSFRNEMAGFSALQSYLRKDKLHFAPCEYWLNRISTNSLILSVELRGYRSASQVNRSTWAGYQSTWRLNQPTSVDSHSNGLFLPIEEPALV